MKKPPVGPLIDCVILFFVSCCKILAVKACGESIASEIVLIPTFFSDLVCCLLRLTASTKLFCWPAIWCRERDVFNGGQKECFGCGKPIRINCFVVVATFAASLDSERAYVLI